MKYEIKHRWTNATLFTSADDCPSFRVFLDAAVKAGVVLSGAVLRGAFGAVSK
jgi:hypothetical protein